MSRFANSRLDIGFPLVGRARFRLSGGDCFRYLNGQVSQDLRRVTHQLALPACVTSAKGRLQAEVWVVAENQAAQQRALLVDAPGELRETLLQRLERYIVADDVVVEDVTGLSELVHFPVAEMPEVEHFPAVSRAKAARLGETGWDVWVSANQFDAFCTGLGERLGRVENYERLRIERGIPAWGAELTEDTLPPEAGLDRTHVDYHKGCYIGQEVISRLKSVGHVNQTLRQFTGKIDPLAAATGLAQPAGPSSGDLLYLAGTHENAVGKLTSVVSGLAGEFLALGYLKRGVLGVDFQTTNGVSFTAVS
jgi:folate-binding protein YgfZ